MEMCKASRVAGIILCSGSVETERFRDLNVPLVTIERFLEYGTSAVECDNRQGGRLAAQHLLECGCTNVIYLSGEMRYPCPRTTGRWDLWNSAGRKGCIAWIRGRKLTPGCMRRWIIMLILKNSDGVSGD